MKKAQFSTIAADLPFVDALASEVLGEYGDDPLTLANILVLLPNRRSCRALREAFLRETQGKPLLLPRMQPIGDLDEEQELFSEWMEGVVDSAEPAIPPMIEPIPRILALAQLVGVFERQRGKEIADAQVIQYAKLLARFIDEVDREQLSYDALHQIVPDDLAVHWQEILQFLEILRVHWPAYLEEHRLIDPVRRRNRMTLAYARYLESNPVDYPIIAAGTTGSVKATAELLHVIAKLPRGRVILPGFEPNVSRETFLAYGPTHPQYGMAHLLDVCDVSPGDVAVLGKCNDSARSLMLSTAMLPAEVSEAWGRISLDVDTALTHVSRVDAANEHDEARVVSLIMREILETPDKNCALVTHDRELAARVTALLGRYGIAVDDSVGAPIADTPTGVFLRLLIDVAESRASAVSVLALLKHPFACAGYTQAEMRSAIRELEHAWRQSEEASLYISVEGVFKACADERFRKILKNVSRETFLMLDAVSEKLSPFLALYEESQLAIDALLGEHLKAAEALAPEGVLWQGEQGKSVSGFFQRLHIAAKDYPTISPASYRSILEALMAGEVWRPGYGSHPRLYILSPMEARLQHFDRVILSGLNEGSWPGDVLADPWMSRPMRGQFGLPELERHIGLAAHDFTMLAHAPEVFFTRAVKHAGTPTVASRWLMKLEALLKGQGAQKAQWFAEHWNVWAKQFYQPDAALFDLLPALKAPQVAPPIQNRPHTLSVTAIEKLMRDPYGMYAEYILKLRPLEALDVIPGAREFGVLVHEALAHFVQDHPDTLPENAYEVLIQSAEILFAKRIPFEEVRRLWWPRFQMIAEWFIQREAVEREQIQHIYAEVTGESEWQTGDESVRIRAIADRIDLFSDGSVRIVDYKTGSLPERKDLNAGVVAQLAIEAMILLAGGFTAIDAKEIDALEYWKVSGGAELGKIQRANDANARNTKETIEKAIERVRSQLQTLLDYYYASQSQYPVRPLPGFWPKYSNYDHLERIDEWMYS